MLTVPPHWSTASAAQLAPVAGGPSLLMLDYDGTLAPFQDDRMQALPFPGVAERIHTLSHMPTVRLALVTGRSARELAELLPFEDKVDIWGSHGREQLTAAGVYSCAPLAPAQQNALDQLEAALTAVGLGPYLERKPASLAAHWRMLDADAALQMEKIASAMHNESGARAGMQLLTFDGGVEMRSPSIHKGHAVLHMVRQSPTAAAAYLGDDITDEDAFAVLRGRGLTVLVRDEPRPSQANYWLRPPDELLGFLDAWIRAAERAIG